MDRLSDFDYHLPENLIAQTPLEDRSASRLLRLHRDGQIEHRKFTDVVGILQPGDLLVINDTRVNALRLFGNRSTGASIEALLLREVRPRCFEALVKPGKRMRVGAIVEFGDNLVASVTEELEDGIRVLEFKPVEHLRGKLDSIGWTPLPPYIHETLRDRERYQTVYGSNLGSAAAPTAGLHFTNDVLAALKEKGVELATVTLHVGLDTFRPVQADDLSEHRMHGESCSIDATTAEKIANAKGRIIAVGTTTVRTLETFAIGRRRVSTGTAHTKIFIRPGYNFQIIDGMFTNFHLPRTTMLMMLAALVGREKLFAAYEAAVREGYRFLSFGDSMLIL